MDDKEYQKKLQEQQMDVVRKAALLRYMTKDARERLNRIRLVKPELANKVEYALLNALQMGRIKDRLTDVQLKEILTQVIETKDFNLKINKK